MPSADSPLARAAEARGGASRCAVKEEAWCRAELAGADPAATSALEPRVLCAPGRRAREAGGDDRRDASWYSGGTRASKGAAAWTAMTSATSRSQRPELRALRRGR